MEFCSFQSKHPSGFRSYEFYLHKTIDRPTVAVDAGGEEGAEGVF
jgi:hypothetical protein